MHVIWLNLETWHLRPWPLQACLDSPEWQTTPTPHLSRRFCRHRRVLVSRPLASPPARLRVHFLPDPRGTRDSPTHWIFWHSEPKPWPKWLQYVVCVLDAVAIPKPSRRFHQRSWLFWET